MSHWSSELPVCFPSWGTQVHSPGGHLCKTRILLLALSCYIVDPGLIDYCGLVCGRLRPKRPLGLIADNVIIPLDLTQLFCPSFTLAASPPSSFITDIVGFWGEPYGEPAISLHSHHVSLVQWTTCLLPVMRDRGSIPMGLLLWNQDSPVRVVSLQTDILYITKLSEQVPFYNALPTIPVLARIRRVTGIPTSFCIAVALLTVSPVFLIVNSFFARCIILCRVRNSMYLKILNPANINEKF